MRFIETALVWLLKALIFVYDVITLPLYAALHQPWVRLRRHKERKSQAISSENGITYRSLTRIPSQHIDPELGELDTLDKVFSYAVKRNGRNRCLGSREVIAQEDEVQPDGKVFTKYALGDDYRWKSYDDVDQLALVFSKGLLELCLIPKCRIAIFAETRAEWMISAIASFKQNLTVVTLYASLGEDAIAHGLNETEVSVVITSHDLLAKFREILKSTPAVRNVIYMEDPLQKTDTTGYRSDVRILSFHDIISLGSRSIKGTSPPARNDIAIIMYTSGSTGAPKGVLLSHKNIVTAMFAFLNALGPVHDEDILIAFLPLAHVLELMCETICLLLGIPIGYSSALTITDQSSKIKLGGKGDISVLRPTLMAAVPLILDRIFKSIQDQVRAQSTVAQTLFKIFYDYKLKWFYRGYGTPLLDKLVFSKIRRMLGGSLRMVACGGAPLSPQTEEFLKLCLGVPIVQGYGLTETSACASLTASSEMSLGRVGAPLSCCDIQLVDWEQGNYRVTDLPYPRGEILIGGDNVALGYFKLPLQTSQDFFLDPAGRRWFRSGDIAEVHSDGVFKIIDRKKDLVKLQFGEYVSLGKVESIMKTCPLVDNICIHADSMKLSVVALVVPSSKHFTDLAERFGRRGLTFEEMCRDPELVKKVLHELQEHGRRCKLVKFEIPVTVTLVSEVWSPDTGLVTAAFKLRRKIIQERYQHEINSMYSSPPSSSNRCFERASYPNGEHS